MVENREQKLVDIMFSVALLINDKEYRKEFEKMNYEQTAAWVSRQLKLCGFETTPCGSSWGVLNNK